MLLADEGVIALDDPISRHLPDLPHANQITIRQLMSHQSGLVDYRDLPEFWAAIMTDLERVLDVG